MIPKIPFISIMHVSVLLFFGTDSSKSVIKNWWLCSYKEIELNSFINLAFVCICIDFLILFGFFKQDGWLEENVKHILFIEYVKDILVYHFSLMEYFLYNYKSILPFRYQKIVITNNKSTDSKVMNNEISTLLNDNKCKVVFLGDASVGKTSLV